MGAFIYSDGVSHKLLYNIGPKIKYMAYATGLTGIRYVGYFNDDQNWFDTATPHGDTNTLTEINNFSSNDDFYTWEWNGYFKPSSSETYTFYTSSDDSSLLWIDNILVVNNGGLHGNSEQSGTINLTANIYYPIKIQFGENSGGDVITVNFSSNTISKTTDGNGYYFH